MRDSFRGGEGTTVVYRGSLDKPLPESRTGPPIIFSVVFAKTFNPKYIITLKMSFSIIVWSPYIKSIKSSQEDIHKKYKRPNVPLYQNLNPTLKDRLNEVVKGIHPSNYTFLIKYSDIFYIYIYKTIVCIKLSILFFLLGFKSFRY